MTAYKRFGLTWWGRRWIEALEQLGETWENRLPRGRTYARKGNVADLRVAPGRVTAAVAGSRPDPYRVEIDLPVFDDDTWRRIVASLAGEIRHAAALLDGRMPDDVDEVLAGLGVSVFPTAGALQTACTCPDWANPCKHIAAVHYVLAETLDADPFLLCQLRGRDRDALLAALRARRAGVEEPPAAVSGDDGTVALDRIEARALFDASGALEDVELHPTPPEETGAALRRLGPPPGPAGAAAGRLEDAVTGAARRAWRVLLDPGDDHAPTGGGRSPPTAVRSRG